MYTVQKIIYFNAQFNNHIEHLQIQIIDKNK